MFLDLVYCLTFVCHVILCDEGMLCSCKVVHSFSKDYSCPRRTELMYTKSLTPSAKLAKDPFESQFSPNDVACQECLFLSNFLVQCLPVDYHMRFSRPVTPLTARRVRHGRIRPHLPASAPLQGTKTHSYPA